ncbi:MAG: hypothetical protein ACJ76I_11800 [Gaiellaceae bacterium]
MRAAPVQLWDVRNVEAHCRRALDSYLLAAPAWLDPHQYDRCLQFLRIQCWRLSGLQADAKSLRWVWEIRGFISPRGELDPYEKLDIDEFGSELSAELALAELRVELPIAFAKIVKCRPAGAYDPTFGISFSTYSWRLLSGPRIADWYRQDEDFGDNRYESNRRSELSLEALGKRAHEDGDVEGLTPAPVGRLEVVDSLNAHHYIDAGEEVLSLEAFGIGG